MQNQKLHLCRIGKKKKCMRQDGKETVYHVLAVRPRTEGDQLANFPNWAELKKKPGTGGMLDDVDIDSELVEDPEVVLAKLNSALEAPDIGEGDPSENLFFG